MNFLEKEVVSTLILSPKKYQKLEKVKITYFCSDSPFGNYLAAFFEEELCYLGFYDSNFDPCLKELETLFRSAVFICKNDFEPPNELKVLLKGTDFEVETWRELLKIKKGSTVSYDYIARAIGKPKSVRAVGNAIGKNHIGYIVPCHRVIRKNGELGGFGSGPRRKLKMLAYEKAKL